MRDTRRGGHRRGPGSRWGHLVLALAVVVLAVGCGVLALVITPLQTVTAAGQTIQVGAAHPTWGLSGPGELDLFGQQIPTTVTFIGPVRPRLVLTHLSLTDQLDQFLRGGLAGAGNRLEQALISGWEHYFTWQVVATGLIALLVFGALAGWLRRTPRATAVMIAAGLLLAEAINLGAIMVTAYTVPSRLATITSLNQLVGGIPPPTLSRHTAAAHTRIHRVVVVGDSVAAGKGNPLIAHPSADAKICNRSRDAFAADLATSNHWQVTNLGCSGATIRAGLLGPQHAAGHTIPPQLDNPAVARADLIIVTIGADDVHWPVLLGLCAISPDCANPAQRALLQQQLAGFSRDLLTLISQLQLLNNHPIVVINQYYDPFPGDTACLRSHGLTTAKKDTLQGELDALNTILAKGATAAGFRTATPNFTGHGLCSRQPYVQGLTAKAPFHPTASGQLAIALAIEDTLHLHTTPTPTPAQTPPGRAPAQPTTTPSAANRTP